MSRLILSTLILFSAFSAHAMESTKSSKLSITQCRQRGWPVEKGLDWEVPQCSPSEVQVELKPTGNLPTPGGTPSVAVVRKGEWVEKEQQGQIQSKVTFEESIILNSQSNLRNWSCLITIQTSEFNYSITVNQSCSDLTALPSSEIAGKSEAFNNFAVRPTLGIRLAESH